MDAQRTNEGPVGSSNGAPTRQFRGPSDLHMHSVLSDGTELPAQVVEAAQRHGMRTMALTDHDTTAGWSEAAQAATALGMTFLPGMELSAKYEWRSVHILAYLFDPNHPGLVAETDRIRDSRLGRAEAMVNNIARDYDLNWDDVIAQTSDGATVGRPHIADALVARGHASDRSAAFAEILHPSRGYFVSHYAPDPALAVSLIVEAGGVPIIAHPVTAGRERMLPMGVLRNLIDLGLGGFEIDHRENTEDGKKILRKLALEHELIVTGSSDYHGTGKPNVPGEFTTTDEMVARIIARATGSAPVSP